MQLQVEQLLHSYIYVESSWKRIGQTTAIIGWGGLGRQQAHLNHISSPDDANCTAMLKIRGRMEQSPGKTAGNNQAILQGNHHAKLLGNQQAKLQGNHQAKLQGNHQAKLQGNH